MRALTGLSLLFMLSAAASEPGSNRFLWRDPGAVETLDLALGAGGAELAPQPPFVFQQEDMEGKTPKLLLQDQNRRLWSVKFGPEARAEAFSTRMLWAVGYPTDIVYLVKSGKIDSVGHLTRASQYIDRSNGNSFQNARFELRDPKVSPEGRWSFVENPFLGSRELKGLKVMMMLLSNWDVKDTRSSDGPNTSIMKHTLDNGAVEHRYIVDDWGASMGKWGDFFTREKWDCKGYEDQSEDFIKGVNQTGHVGFGFEGKRTTDMSHGVTVDDVKWLMQYLGRISDRQIRGALAASGANQEEVECFTKAVRSRIDQLARVSQK